MPPATASFLLIIAGFAAFYLELFRPGLILPGVAGLAAILSGFYFLGRLHPSPAALLLAACAILFFTLEFLLPFRSLAALLATVLLTATAADLPGVPRALSLPLTLLLGAVTTLLIRSARRAQANKHALTPEN